MIISFHVSDVSNDEHKWKGTNTSLKLLHYHLGHILRRGTKSILKMRVDPRAASWTWWWRCTSLAGLVSSLSHIVKIFTRGGGKARWASWDMFRYRAKFSLQGKPHILGLVDGGIDIISSMDASARSSFVAIDSCLLVRATLGGNPRYGSPRSDDGGVWRHSPPCGHHFWS
jgi:hypothetical protein